MKGQDLGTIAGIGFSIFIIGDALADGKVDIWNDTNPPSGEYVDIYDNGGDASYIPTPNKLHTYLTDDPNGINGKLKGVGINSHGFFLKKMFFKADSNVANGSDNFIDINYMWTEGWPEYTPLNMEGKNIVMRQAKESPRTINRDPNTYDLVESTEEFTKNVHLGLPKITASTPRSPAHYDIWDFIATKRGDVTFNGRINWYDFVHLHKYFGSSGHGPHDNWADFADITKNGIVDLEDVSEIAGNWLWDGTAGQLISAYDGKSRHEIEKDRLKRDRKAFAKRMRKKGRRAA